MIAAGSLLGAVCGGKLFGGQAGGLSQDSRIPTRNGSGCSGCIPFQGGPWLALHPPPPPPHPSRAVQATEGQFWLGAAAGPQTPALSPGRQQGRASCQLDVSSGSISAEPQAGLDTLGKGEAHSSQPCIKAGPSPTGWQPRVLPEKGPGPTAQPTLALPGPAKWRGQTRLLPVLRLEGKEIFPAFLSF